MSPPRPSPPVYAGDMHRKATGGGNKPVKKAGKDVTFIKCMIISQITGISPRRQMI